MAANAQEQPGDSHTGGVRADTDSHDSQPLSCRRFLLSRQPQKMRASFSLIDMLAIVSPRQDLPFSGLIY